MAKMISAHISLKEATASPEAIRHGLDNTPGPTELMAMKLVAEKVFEPLRALVSEKRGKDSPIKINSFYRSAEVNKKVGGSKTSQHCLGEAIDIETNYPDFNNLNLFTVVKDNFDFDQCILEFIQDGLPAWIHVSYRKEGNRREILIATRRDGTTKYLPFSAELYSEIYG